ncbi:MAG TPA: substrate-binding domain-containing protein [Acidimicrobiia bacterium]|nr:substrate-binding domain-containing protein [Acidimicrobiia bacterium]
MASRKRRATTTPENGKANEADTKERRTMMRRRVIALMAVWALVVVACGGDAAETTTTAAPGTTTTTAAGTTTTAGEETTTTAGVAEGPLSDYGESIDADPALVTKALGPVEPSDEASWNIVLASIARANQDLDQATIDKAMECWSSQECDTGSGGELVMGYADGGGNDVNVWRSVSHMEAVLQALTYPEIGTIVSTAANFDPDPAIHANDIRFLIQRGVDFIVGYPDMGVAIADAILEANAAGIPYVPFSAGWVGLPDQEGALVPGEDYLTVVGEDLCALGESFAEVLNTGVGTGKVATLGGTPGNALSLGWQRCEIAALADGIELVNPPADENSTTGDTNWYNPIIPDVFRGLLTTNPDIAGWAYEYADGLYTGLQVYDELGIPVQNLTVALRTDEQTLFCDWAERNEPTYNIWFSAGGNFQSRTGVTAAMLSINGADVPAEVVVPHVMRQVTAADCNPDRVNPVVSGTSLVPDSVLALMFGG